jgi:hypothetical protein
MSGMDKRGGFTMEKLLREAALILRELQQALAVFGMSPERFNELVAELRSRQP